MADPGGNSRPTDARLVRLGANLRTARLQAGLSQQLLATGAGVSQGEISRVEAGLREPGVLTVLHLARALDIPPEELTGGMIRW